MVVDHKTLPLRPEQGPFSLPFSGVVGNDEMYYNLIIIIHKQSLAISSKPITKADPFYEATSFVLAPKIDLSEHILQVGETLIPFEFEIPEDLAPSLDVGYPGINANQSNMLPLLVMYHGLMKKSR